jgi:hypothetical protein
MPTLAVHRTSGPVEGQVRKMPFWFEMLLRFGPRYCGQSCANNWVVQVNNTNNETIRFTFFILSILSVYFFKGFFNDYISLI